VRQLPSVTPGVGTDRRNRRYLESKFAIAYIKSKKIINESLHVFSSRETWRLFLSPICGLTNRSGSKFSGGASHVLINRYCKSNNVASLFITSTFNRMQFGVNLGLQRSPVWGSTQYVMQGQQCSRSGRWATAAGSLLPLAA